MAEEHLTAVEQIAKEHLDAPKDSGCIWRYATGKDAKHNAECCDHTKNSYEACRGRAPYQSDDYLTRAQTSRRVRKIYQDKAAEKTASAGNALTSPDAKLRKWAENFNEQEWLKRKRAMFKDAFDRLYLKGSKAWKVGALIELTPGERKTYFGSRGPHNPKPNHQAPRGLGGWYPYDHEHHHIIPVGNIKYNVVLDEENKESKVNAQDRVNVLVQSKWNINNELNVTLLPKDVNVSKVVQLPAHCPWGGKHFPYLRAVKDRLGPVKDAIDAACEMDEKQHEARKEAAADVKDLLDTASKTLYEQITNGTYGGRSLGYIAKPRK